MFGICGGQSLGVLVSNFHQNECSLSDPSYTVGSVIYQGQHPHSDVNLLVTTKIKATLLVP